MRLIPIVIVLWSSQAFGLNWRTTTRADHKSLDVVVRRLENGSEEDIRASLEHLRPMLARHGGPLGWRGVSLGSDEEIDLVCAQHGYANTHKERGEIAKSLTISIFRWIRESIWAIMVGLGPTLTILVVLFLFYRYRGAVIRAFDADAEKLPKEQRAVFTHPLVQKEHAKLKKKAKSP
jgi:hypothetical protein